MYTLEDLKKFQKENKDIWKYNREQLVRKYIIPHMQNASITYSEAVAIEKEFDIPHDDWSRYGGKDEDY